jgi:hypothetical protein
MERSIRIILFHKVMDKSTGLLSVTDSMVCCMKAKSKVTIARLENGEAKWSFVGISGERA